MKRKLVPALLALLLLTGCGKQTASFFAMDTVMEFTIYGEEDLLEGAMAVITELEKQVSTTDPSSQIYAINESGSGRLAGSAAELMAGALDMCRRTGGALDLSIYPVVRAWGFTTGEYQVPEAETLHELLGHVDYTRIGYDAAGNVALEDGMMIDLGSVAKGYAGTLAAAYLRENGVRSALLNLGGNVQTVGAKPDGAPWRIAVKDPASGEPMLVLSVQDQAVVTSGGYERYFEQNGQTYWHIIDPATGCPADSGLASVTVVGEDGLVCDGLSTALFILGLEGASELWRSSGDFEAVFITDEGAVYITEGLQDSFTLLDGWKGRQVGIVER